MVLIYLCTPTPHNDETPFTHSHLDEFTMPSQDLFIQDQRPDPELGPVVTHLETGALPSGKKKKIANTTKSQNF